MWEPELCYYNYVGNKFRHNFEERFILCCYTSQHHPQYHTVLIDLLTDWVACSRSDLASCFVYLSINLDRGQADACTQIRLTRKAWLSNNWKCTDFVTSAWQMSGNFCPKDFKCCLVCYLVLFHEPILSSIVKLHNVVQQYCFRRPIWWPRR